MEDGASLFADCCMEARRQEPGELGNVLRRQTPPRVSPHQSHGVGVIDHLSICGDAALVLQGLEQNIMSQ